MNCFVYIFHWVQINGPWILMEYITQIIRTEGVVLHYSFQSKLIFLSLEAVPLPWQPVNTESQMSFTKSSWWNFWGVKPDANTQVRILVSNCSSTKHNSCKIKVYDIWSLSEFYSLLNIQYSTFKVETFLKSIFLYTKFLKRNFV